MAKIAPNAGSAPNHLAPNHLKAHPAHRVENRRNGAATVAAAVSSRLYAG